MARPRTPPGTVRVDLTPSPGFCVKSIALQPAVVHLPAASPPTDDGAAATLLEPSAGARTLTIPKGAKLFVNIAFSPAVPPPPPGSDTAIKAAVSGDAPLPGDERGGLGWFVPVVVSEPREDRDKAGKPSVVFDAVFHEGLRAQTRADAAFKTFVTELAFQRIEEQAGVQLSRQIGTPNIKFKGKPEPRSVLVPAALVQPAAGSSKLGAGKRGEKVSGAGAGAKLIEEVEVGVAKGESKAAPEPEEEQLVETEGVIPEVDFSRNAQEVRIMLKVPRLTHADVPRTTLDLEPRRLILRSPVYALDLDLDRSDAQLRELKMSEPGLLRVLGLKRVRDLAVDRARAEWRVGEGLLVLYA